MRWTLFDSVRVAWIWVPLKPSKAKLSTTFVAVRGSGDGRYCCKSPFASLIRKFSCAVGAFFV